MDPCLETQNRIKNKRQVLISGQKKESKRSNYISNLFTRTLISVILVLLCAIFVNLKDENLLFFKEKLFQDTLSFQKINAWYTKYFGSILPLEKTDNTTAVFQSDAMYQNIEPYADSYKATINGPAVFLESGIIVFLGEKENLGNTVIVQGIDGVDIWYSNITTNDLTLYDYVEKDSIVGDANNNEIIFTFMENGNYIGYEKYIS